jgi:hypothetical protein
MWKNIVEPDRPQMTIWRMRIACWITKATGTHSEYIVFIAFPRQQWIHKRASMLRYTYIVSLAPVNIISSTLLLTGRTVEDLATKNKDRFLFGEH